MRGDAVGLLDIAGLSVLIDDFHVLDASIKIERFGSVDDCNWPLAALSSAECRIGCVPVHTAGRLSGPHIRHAPATTRQICKGIKSIEMVDRQIGNAFRHCEAHIHGSPVATIISGLNRNIVGHTAAMWAEMKVDNLNRPGIAGGSNS